MKSKRQKSAIKTFFGSIFQSQIQPELSAKTVHDLLIKLISVTKKKFRIFMCEQDYENKKNGDYDFL